MGVTKAGDGLCNNSTIDGEIVGYTENFRMLDALEDVRRFFAESFGASPELECPILATEVSTHYSALNGGGLTSPEDVKKLIPMVEKYLASNSVNNRCSVFRRSHVEYLLKELKAADKKGKGMITRDSVVEFRPSLHDKANAKGWLDSFLHRSVDPEALFGGAVQFFSPAIGEKPMVIIYNDINAEYHQVDIGETMNNVYEAGFHVLFRMGKTIKCTKSSPRALVIKQLCEEHGASIFGLDDEVFPSDMNVCTEHPIMEPRHIARRIDTATGNLIDNLNTYGITAAFLWENSMFVSDIVLSLMEKGIGVMVVGPNDEAEYTKKMIAPVVNEWKGKCGKDQERR